MPRPKGPKLRAEDLVGLKWLSPLDERCRGVPQIRKLADIAAKVVAVDGSFMRCVPSMAWAIFRQQSELRGVRLHAHLDLKTSLPPSTSR